MSKSQLGFMQHPDPDRSRAKPYILDNAEGWDSVDVAYIDENLTRCIGEVSGSYNAWVFSKFAWKYEPVRYQVKRWTWETGGWYSYDLTELVATIRFDSIQLTTDLPHDAYLVSVDDLWHDNQWGEYYRGDRSTFDEYYGRMSYIWLVDRPYARCMAYTYDRNISTASRLFSDVKYIQPNKRT